MDFGTAFERLIGHEGGFTNDSKDAGNWTGGKVGVGKLLGTKYGIAANTYPLLDIPNITLDQAKTIYFNDWWKRLGADKFHPAITFQLWDFAINSGRYRAIMELQNACGVLADGVLGPITYNKVNSMDLNDVLMLILARRLRFLASISGFNTYGAGWVNRCASNLEFASQDN